MPDRLKLSRTLARLDEGMSGVEVDCKRAERAAGSARLGLTVHAKMELDALRQRYEAQSHAEVSARLNLV